MGDLSMTDVVREAKIAALKARRAARGMDDPLNRLRAHNDAAIAAGAAPVVEERAPLRAVTIIEHSLRHHCAEFVGALADRAASDLAYADKVQGRAKDGALASVRAYERAKEIALRTGQTATVRAIEICAATGPAVVALNIAGRLQGLPQYQLTAAAIEIDERRDA
jgi:hypothetical protein